MNNWFKDYLIKKIEKAFDDSYKSVNTIIKKYVTATSIEPKVLDIGSGKGDVTKKYLKNVKVDEIYGLDVIKPSKFKSIKYTYLDLEGAKYPYKSNFFDVVISGQTIEHVLDKDKMIEEAHRVLKPGGIFVCATENIASFDNIISVLLGQEPLSQNTGSKLNTTSFLSPNYMKKVGPNGNKYLHKNVPSYYGLQRLCRVNGFKDCKIKSFGNLCKPFELLFPIYNRVIVVYATK